MSSDNEAEEVASYCLAQEDTGKQSDCCDNCHDSDNGDDEHGTTDDTNAAHQNNPNSKQMALYQFYIDHGHVNVPRRYPIDAKLATFVKNAQSQKKKTQEILSDVSLTIPPSVKFSDGNVERTKGIKKPDFKFHEYIHEKDTTKCKRLVLWLNVVLHQHYDATPDFLIGLRNYQGRNRGHLAQWFKRDGEWILPFKEDDHRFIKWIEQVAVHMINSFLVRNGKQPCQTVDILFLKKRSNREPTFVKHIDDNRGHNDNFVGTLSLCFIQSFINRRIRGGVRVWKEQEVRCRATERGAYQHTHKDIFLNPLESVYIPAKMMHCSTLASSIDCPLWQLTLGHFFL